MGNNGWGEAVELSLRSRFWIWGYRFNVLWTTCTQWHQFHFGLCFPGHYPIPKWMISMEYVLLVWTTHPHSTGRRPHPPISTGEIKLYAFIQCLRKVFKPLPFSHILICYSWGCMISESISTPKLKTDVKATVHTYITWCNDTTYIFALQVPHSIPNLVHNVCCVDRAVNKSSSHLKE